MKKISSILIKIAKEIIFSEDFNFDSINKFGPENMLVVKKKVGKIRYAHQILQNELENIDAESRQGQYSDQEKKSDNYIVLDENISKDGGNTWIVKKAEFEKLYQPIEGQNKQIEVFGIKMEFKKYSQKSVECSCFRLPKDAPKEMQIPGTTKKATPGSFIFVTNGKMNQWQRSTESMNAYMFVGYGKAQGGLIDDYNIMISK